ncbi:MAG: YhjD/YihY/BrkB family envelope integrity protein [Anaerolineae bacterium]
MWPGAVAAAPLWSLSKWGLNWYLGRLLLFRVVYGSLTAVVIFLIWAYISGVILLFGAEFSASLYAHHHPPEAVQSRGGLKPRRTAKQG